MAITSSSSPKKRKRRENLYEFHTFPEQGSRINLTGSFRENVRVFLRECGEMEDYTVEGMPVWRTTLVLNKNRTLLAPLFILEETVNNSPRPLCVHCVCSGWGHHFVSKRRYHLIIPRDDEWNKPLKENLFDDQNHLLHGLIHCNGFGHLLSINGIEGGSNFLRGREIMDLWDRICTNLRTRKITVEDVSKKHSMDLRLLYGVAYGHSWYGRWGYKFCRGSFGVNEYKYDTAMDFLGSITLDRLICDCDVMKDGQEINRIIRYYKDLSETRLATIRDLLSFMLTLKIDHSQIFSVPKEKEDNNVEFGIKFAKMESRWSKRRLNFTSEVIADILKEKMSSKLGDGGISRQEIRDAARAQIGDTGLLDFVLKLMNNVVVGNAIVTRGRNPLTRVLEYTIKEISENVQVNEVSEIYTDIFFLYTNVLMGCPEMESAVLASRAVLDSKHFVKEWPLNEANEQSLRLICQIMPSFTNLELDLMGSFPHSEMILVPRDATINEVRGGVEHALRDTYCLMECFKVSEIYFHGKCEVVVRGSGVDLGTELRYEGGTQNWTVQCACGAVDDDGERMLACDACEVWQHTRCNGIGSVDPIPDLFLCDGCYALPLQPIEPEFVFDFGLVDDLLEEASAGSFLFDAPGVLASAGSFL